MGGSRASMAASDLLNCLKRSIKETSHGISFEALGLSYWPPRGRIPQNMCGSKASAVSHLLNCLKSGHKETSLGISLEALRLSPWPLRGRILQNMGGSKASIADSHWLNLLKRAIRKLVL